MQQNKKVIGLVIGVLLFVFLVVLVLPRTMSKATPTKTPSSGAISPSIPTEAVTVTPHEATPQVFPSRDQTKTGGLILTSSPDSVRVIIDPPQEEGGSKASPLPVNTTPVQLSNLPAGTYQLIASKTGYNYTTQTFTVMQDQITTVNITLSPLEQ